MRGRLVVWVILASCASTSPSQNDVLPTPFRYDGESQADRRQAVFREETCEAFLGDDTPVLCDQVAAEERQYQEAEAAKTRRANERAVERASERQARQLGADRELRGDALAGDGQYSGQGWYCFEGEQQGVVVGGCRRDIVDCGMDMANRKVKGMTTNLERCEPSAEAACLQLTRSLREGPRVFCYPQEVQCTRANKAAHARDDVQSVIDCDVYR